MSTHLDGCHVAGVESTFEIRVSGTPGARLTEQFPRLDAIADPPETLLLGPLRDQSELHALIALVDSLGLELIEVRRVPGGG